MYYYVSYLIYTNSQYFHIFYRILQYFTKLSSFKKMDWNVSYIVFRLEAIISILSEEETPIDKS